MIDNVQPAVLAALIAGSAALGTAIFAFIAAMINAGVARKNAILSAQIAQRTKRADFRQAWIDKLRESLVKTQVGFMDPDGLSREGAEHAMRTLLLVNRNDVDYQRLSDCIHNLTKKESISEEEIDSSAKELLEVSQDLLKREWNVVKNEINKFEDDARSMRRLFSKGQ